MKYLLKKEVVSIYYSGSSAGILGGLVVPMLLILFHISSSLCSEVFTPIHCCIYSYAVKYLHLFSFVFIQKKEVFIKKKVVSIYYSGPSAGIFGRLVVGGSYNYSITFLNI